MKRTYKKLLPYTAPHSTFHNSLPARISMAVIKENVPSSVQNLLPERIYLCIKSTPVYVSKNNASYVYRGFQSNIRRMPFFDVTHNLIESVSFHIQKMHSYYYYEGEPLVCDHAAWEMDYNHVFTENFSVLQEDILQPTKDIMTTYREYSGQWNGSLEECGQLQVGYFLPEETTEKNTETIHAHDLFKVRMVPESSVGEKIRTRKWVFRVKLPEENIDVEYVSLFYYQDIHAKNTFFVCFIPHLSYDEDAHAD